MSAHSLFSQSLVAVLIAAPCMALAAESQEPASYSLTYEADLDGSLPEPDAMRELCTVINGRLNGAGRAQAAGGRRIQVELYGQISGEHLESLKFRIAALGDLEFRVTAATNAPRHQAAIEQAQQLPPDETEVRVSEKIVARWLTFDEREFGAADEARQKGFVVRTAGATPQMLVIVDDGLDVTGDSLKSAEAGVDDAGRPTIELQFTSKGAFLFGQLTGAHTPGADGQRYRLAIVFDNHVLTAPVIEGKISDRATISGAMTQHDVDAILAVLMAGRLPAAIRLIEEKPIAR